MASTVESITAQLRELIDNANATTGNADDNVTDCINELIKRYRPTGSMEGLENGWDVMFYDENNEGVAFYSVLQGMTIEAPSITVDSWQTEDGTLIAFPYTPTSDIILYANMPTFATKLYEHFDKDVVSFPYLAIVTNNSSNYIVFAKEVYKSNDTCLATKSGYWATINVDLTETDLNVLVENIINASVTLKYASGDVIYMHSTGTTTYLLSNFNPSDFGVAIEYISLV